MAATAKLSREFYERLGDGVANELVEWVNNVDESRRQEYLDLRRDIGQLEVRVDGVAGTLVALEARMDVKFATLKADLMKWMFIFWATSIGTLLAVRF